jgi:RNA-binding protein Nova
MTPSGWPPRAAYGSRTLFGDRYEKTLFRRLSPLCPLNPLNTSLHVFFSINIYKMSQTPKRRLLTGPNNEDLAAKREAFNSGPCWAKLLVSDKVAGSVIGKGGTVISDLEKATTTIIKLSPGRTYFPGTQERLIVISGELSHVQEAVKLIADKVSVITVADTSNDAAIAHGGPPMDQDVTMKLVVPNSAVSCIIGRGGEVVRDINKTTGALIRASERFAAIHERIVQISGSPSEVVSAANEVVKRIQADRNLKEHLNVVYSVNADVGGLASPPSSPSPHVGAPAVMFEQATGGAGMGVGVLSFPCSIGFEVEDAVVTGIMGKGGVVLQRVAGQTGATVTISGLSGDKRHMMRTVRISGTLAAVQQAHLMVMRHIYEFSRLREPFHLLQT